jgi:UDPglucose--hexose-1-phosphate uridylyltransferase
MGLVPSMAYPTIRHDTFLNERVIILPPSAGTEDTSAGCPYCPGQEARTGPAELVMVQRGGGLLKADEREGPVPGWLIRVFRAPLPILSTTARGREESQSNLLTSEPGFGHHLILVATPRHGRRLEDLDQEEWMLALWALQDRLKWLYLQTGVSYVSVYSDEPDMSLHMGIRRRAEHALIHMVGLPFIPPVIASEGEAFARGVEVYAQCPLCRLAGAESKGPRHLVATQGFVAFCPWSSRCPYESWVIPKTHQHSPMRLTQRELRDLGLILNIVLKSIRRVVGDSGYSLVLHSASERRSAAEFHWHIEIYPELTMYRGLTYGHGVPVNPVSPEEAAKVLGPLCRELLAKHLGVS